MGLLWYCLTINIVSGCIGMISEDTQDAVSSAINLARKKRHLECPDFGNINNSDATGCDMSCGAFKLHTQRGLQEFTPLEFNCLLPYNLNTQQLKNEN